MSFILAENFGATVVGRVVFTRDDEERLLDLLVQLDGKRLNRVNRSQLDHIIYGVIVRGEISVKLHDALRRMANRHSLPCPSTPDSLPPFHDEVEIPSDRRTRVEKLFISLYGDGGATRLGAILVAREDRVSKWKAEQREREAEAKYEAQLAWGSTVKLTETQILEIAASRLPWRILASTFGCCYSTIHNIKFRRRRFAALRYAVIRNPVGNPMWRYREPEPAC